MNRLPILTRDESAPKPGQMYMPIYIGLAAGIGHLGIAAVMALFLCFTNVLLWYFDFGQNPIDNRRIAKKHAELESSSPSTESSQQLP